jgi:hypothetical protein
LTTPSHGAIINSSCGAKGVIQEGAMTTVSKVKRGWTDGISHLALLVVLILPVPLIAQTPFETPYPVPARAPDARSSIGEGWFLKDKVIPRQASPAPYPDTLILVGTYETPGKARDVWVEYPLAYLAGDHIGVEVIDVSDPTNPILVNTIDTPGQAFDIMAQDTLVCVADDYSGFQILNGTGIVGGYDTPRICRGVLVQDTFAYVADYDSLLVLNVSDPAAPWAVGSITLGSEPRFEAVFVQGSYAYVVDLFAVYIIDVSDPSHPQYAGEYSDSVYWFIPYNVYVINNLAYVANYFNELFIIDVSNPANPFRVSFAYPPTGYAWDVKVIGNYAYVANWDGGLWAVDVSDPANPQTAAVYDTPDLCGGVFADSNYIYVADHYSLLIFERTPNGIAESYPLSPMGRLRLTQNSPNPFCGLTTIRYELPAPARVHIRIHDSAGRLTNELVDKESESGVHSIVWDGKDLSGEHAPSGVYFCRLSSGSRVESRKMVLLR